MKAGVIVNETGPAVVMPLGERWINVSAAWSDYNTNVESRTAPPLRSVMDLLAGGLMTRSFYRRMSEYAQRYGRLDQYALPGRPDFEIPLRPGKVVCIGRNYAAHAEELGNAVPEEPLFFGKTATACIGPGQPIHIAEWYGRVDHEGELGVLIGRRAKDVAADDAYDYIAGYTLVNDVTARDLQSADKKRGHPWFRAKNMDTFCPLGPLVIFPDVLPWPVSAELTVWVNGEVRQEGNTEQFIFDIPTLLAHVSQYMTLEVGDVIATGTPEGVGPLEAGDVVEIEVPEIGLLVNPVTG